MNRLLNQLVLQLNSTSVREDAPNSDITVSVESNDGFISAGEVLIDGDGDDVLDDIDIELIGD
jgi:hypothetical protein